MSDFAQFVSDPSPRLEEILTKVREIGPLLRERAVAAEHEGRLSQDTVNVLDAAGVYKIGTPAEYGGYELPLAERLEVITQVSSWDGSCGWSVWVGASQNWIPVRSGRPVVEEVYGSDWVGPRTSGSSHFPGTQGRARRAEGGWIISGGPWTFGSNALWTRWTNLGCLADTAEGPLLIAAQVPVEELEFLDDWHVAGMKGTGSNSLSLVKGELFVPEHRVAPFSDLIGGTRDHGLKGAVWRAPILGLAFSLMMGMSIGIAQGALQRFLDRSKGRPIRGTIYKDQLDAPQTHLMLAEVYSKIRSAAVLAQTNAERTERYGARDAAGEPADPRELQLFNNQVMLESAYSAKWCAEAVELLQRNSGSTAIMEHEAIQRAWRDARVVTLHGALHLETHAENYGRLMAGLEPWNSPFQLTRTQADTAQAARPSCSTKGGTRAEVSA